MRSTDSEARQPRALPLSPPLAQFRAGLDEVDRVIFDARLARQPPEYLRLVGAEVGMPISSLARREGVLKDKLREAKLEIPTPTYEDVEAFRAILTAKERAIFDARMASPPTPHSALGARLGMTRQGVAQIADRLFDEAARGGLRLAKREAA